MSIDRSKLRWNGYGWAAHQDELAARDDVWAWLAGQLGMPALLATPARNLNDIVLPVSKVNGAQTIRLVDMLGADRVHSDKYERAFHARARDYPGLLALRSGDLNTAPDAVVYPRSSDEVMAVLTFAAEQDFAVIPWGAGSAGVDCNSARTIIVNLSGMSGTINADAGTFEAGISGPELEKALQAHGKTLGHRPETFEFSTLGGWIACGEAGSASLRYGSPHDWLIGAKIATPQGVITADEPGLRSLAAGSQGTLGIITEATVRTSVYPEARETREFLFKDFSSAQQVMLQAIEAELPLTSLSLSDAEETGFWQTFYSMGREGRGRLSDLYRGIRGFDNKAAALSVSFEGHSHSVDVAVSYFEMLAAKSRAIAVKNSDIARRIPPGYMRDSFLDRGAAIETFTFDIPWQKLAGLQAGLRSALNNALLEMSPRPGACGIALSTIAALPRNMVRLSITYIFPRLLGGEIAQWQSLKNAVRHVAAPKASVNGFELNILRAVKNTVDPNAILPAIA